MTLQLRHLFVSASLVLGAVAVTPAAAQPAPAEAAQPAPAEPAQPAPAPAPAPAAEPETKAAPEAAAAAGRITAPPAGKGQVVFFRPGRMTGMALSFSVHEGATGVGKLGNGSYFVLVADPGPHAYSIQSEATDTLNLEVEAGETQYVQQTIGMGLMVGRPHLTPSDQATFDKLKLKESSRKASDLKPKA